MVAGGRVRSFAFPTADTLVSGATHTADSVILWDLPTGEKIKSFKEPGVEFHVMSLAATHDGARLVVGGEAYDGNAVAAAKADPAVKKPYEKVGKAECDLRVWDRGSGKIMRRLPGDGQTVLCVDVSRDDRFVAAGSASGMLLICGVSAAGEPRKIKPSASGLPVGGVRFSADGKTLAVAIAGETTGSVLLYSTADWSKRRSYDLDNAGGPVDFLPEGGKVVAAHPRSIAFFGPGAKPIGSVACGNAAGRHTRINALSISHDGRWALAAEGVEYDRVTAAMLLDPAAGVRILNLKTSEQAGFLSGHADAVWQAAFAPDGKSIITCSADGTIRVWELPAAMSATPAPKP